MKPPPQAPSGRAAVEEALLEAAAELFATDGPRATSVRQIATAANVNHGLVHHYFGSKAALLQAVLERSARQLAEHSPEELAQQDEALAPMIDRHWRILARSLLDGVDPQSLQRSYPLIDQLLRQYAAQGMAHQAARTAAAYTVAFEVGWRLLRGFIVEALGLDGATIERLDRGGLLSSDGQLASAGLQWR